MRVVVQRAESAKPIRNGVGEIVDDLHRETAVIEGDLFPRVPIDGNPPDLAPGIGQQQSLVAQIGGRRLEEVFQHNLRRGPLESDADRINCLSTVILIHQQAINRRVSVTALESDLHQRTTLTALVGNPLFNGLGVGVAVQDAGADAIDGAQR